MAQIIIWGLAQKPLRSKNGLVSEIKEVLAGTEYENTCDVTVALSENVLGPSKGRPSLEISAESDAEASAVNGLPQDVHYEVRIKKAKAIINL